MDEFKEIPLEKIVWKHSVRPLDLNHARNLSKSMRLHGQITPLVVESLGDGTYEGVVHRHILEAAKLAYFPTVLCRIHRFSSPQEKRQWQLVENLHRKDLSAVQRAEAYRALRESLREEVAEDRHIVRSMATGIEEMTGQRAPAERTIRKYLQIADELPQEVKTVTGDHFGVRHAEQLLRLKEHPKEQLELAKKFAHSEIEGSPWTVKRLRRGVDAIIKPKGEPSPPVLSRAITYDCPYCGAEYHPFYQGEGDEPHRHGLKRIHRNAEGRETEKQPSLNFACLDCYSRFPTAVKTTIEGATHLTCPSCGSSNIKRLG